MSHGEREKMAKRKAKGKAKGKAKAKATVDKRMRVVKLANHNGPVDEFDEKIRDFCERNGRKVKLMPRTGWCGYLACAEELECRVSDVVDKLSDDDKKRRMRHHVAQKKRMLDSVDYMDDQDILHVFATMDKTVLVLSPQQGALVGFGVQGDEIKLYTEEDLNGTNDVINTYGNTYGSVIVCSHDHFDLLVPNPNLPPTIPSPTTPPTHIDIPPVGPPPPSALPPPDSSPQASGPLSSSSASSSSDCGRKRTRNSSQSDEISGPFQKKKKPKKLNRANDAYPLDKPRFVGDSERRQYEELVAREWDRVEVRSRSAFHTKETWIRHRPLRLNLVYPKPHQGCAIPAMCFLAGCQPLIPELANLKKSTDLKFLKTALKPDWFLQTVDKTPSSPHFLFNFEPGMFLVGTHLIVNGVQYPHWIGYDSFKRVLYPGFGALVKIEEKDYELDTRKTRKNANKVFSDLGLVGIRCCAVLLTRVY